MSLVGRWLRLCILTAGGMSSIPSQGTKILHATGLGQKQTDQQEPKGVTPLTKSHSSTALGWIPNSQNQAISASCYPQPPAWLPHFPSVNLKGIHPWCPMITTDKMRWHPNVKLFHCPRPQNLYCCHPFKPSPHFILLWDCPSSSLSPPPTFFQLCWKPAYKQAQEGQPGRFSHKTQALGRLPFPSSLHSLPSLPAFLFLPCWIINLPSWPENPMLCGYGARDPRERVFWGQMKTSPPLRGRLLRSKARDRSKGSSFLPGLRPRAEAHSPSLQ